MAGTYSYTIQFDSSSVTVPADNFTLDPTSQYVTFADVLMTVPSSSPIYVGVALYPLSGVLSITTDA